MPPSKKSHAVVRMPPGTSARAGAPISKSTPQEVTKVEATKTEDLSPQKLKFDSQNNRHLNFTVPSDLKGIGDEKFLGMSRDEKITSTRSLPTVAIYIHGAKPEDEASLLMREAPLNILQAHCPVIDAAVAGAADPAMVTHVFLPNAPYHAYNSVFQHLKNISQRGIYMKMPIVTNGPTYFYAQYARVMRMLGLKFLYNDLNTRINKMLTYTKGHKFTVYVSDIQLIYKHLPVIDPLRLQLVDSLARAWLNDDIRRKELNLYETVGEEYPEFIAEWNEQAEVIKLELDRAARFPGRYS